MHQPKIPCDIYHGNQCRCTSFVTGSSLCLLPAHLSSHYLQAEKAQQTVKEQLDSQEQEWQHRLQELEQQHAEALKKVEELTQNLVDYTEAIEGHSDKTNFLTYEARLNQLHQLSLQQENQLQLQSSQIELMKKALADAMSMPKSKVKFNNSDVQKNVNTAMEQHISASSSSSSSSSLDTTRMHGKFPSFPGPKDSGLSSPERSVSVYMVKGKDQDKKLNASPVATKFKKMHEIHEKEKATKKYVTEQVEGPKEEVDGEEEEEEEDEEVDDSDTSITSELVTKATDPNNMQQKRKFHGTSKQLQADLRKELQLILDRRLREMGVDPDWCHLPQASLQHKMTTLKHHQHIAAKRYVNYFKVREFLLNKVKQRLIALTGTKTLRDDTSGKKTAAIRDTRSLQVDSIVNRVKRKARILNQSEDTGNSRLLAHSLTGQKLFGERSRTSKHRLEHGAFDDKSTSHEVNHPRTSMKNSHTHSNVPSQSNVHTEPAHQVSNFKEGNAKSIKSEIEPKLTMDVESDESSTESSLTTVVSPRRSKEKHSSSGLTYSSSGLVTTQDEGKPQTSQNGVLLQYSTVFSARSSGDLKTVPIEKGENHHLSSRVDDTDSLRELANTNKPNSALKSPSGSSSLAKKHVVFQDLAVKYSSTLSEKQQERRNVTWDSSDDEAIGPIKKPLEKLPTDIQTTKQKDNSSGSIVAQKSREIKQKISARGEKPTGGVDTVSYLLAPASSAPQDLVEYTQMKRIHSSTMGMKQLPLSEWDIEDLEDFD